MRVVIDTNVFVSAFLWQRTAKEIFVYAENGAITICVTKEIIEEFERVLSYPKFKKQFARIGTTPQIIINELLEIVTIYPSLHFPYSYVQADPSDDKFIACALAADAVAIISGDHHLRALKIFNNIPIVTPTQFLRRMKAE